MHCFIRRIMRRIMYPTFILKLIFNPSCFKPCINPILQPLKPMSSQSNYICGFMLLNKMIDDCIKSPDINEHSKRFAILLNILIEIIVNPVFAKYHALCETLFYNNYHYVNALLQGDQVTQNDWSEAEDYEMIRQVICLIKEEILEDQPAYGKDNKKMVEKLIVYYCD